MSKRDPDEIQTGEIAAVAILFALLIVGVVALWI